MGNTLVQRKIIPRVIRFREIILIKLAHKIYNPRRTTITQPYLVSGFQLYTMPKRGRPSQVETRDSTGSEDEKYEKITKKLRKHSSDKSHKKSRKNKTAKEVQIYVPAEEIKVVEEPKPRKRERKAKVVHKIPPPQVSSASEASEAEEPYEVQEPVALKNSDASSAAENDNTEDEVVAKKEPAKRGRKPTKKPQPPTFVNQTGTNLDEINYNCEKLNGEGKKPNIKICSWNVAGLRAMIKKNGINYIIRENADIVVLQETKCDKNKLPNEVKIPGYKYYCLDSQKSGYCGMALYTKESPISVKYGLKKPEFDIEGRLITAEYPTFYLVTVYVPNAGPKLVTLPKRLRWNEAFKAYIKALDVKKPVILCGDMNVAHKEIDLKNPKGNQKNAGFTKEEREGMTDFLEQGFIDTFRYYYPNAEGAYTFWSYFANARSKNIGWRLDYFLVSERIIRKINDIVIRSQVYGSDHCPVVMYANI